MKYLATLLLLLGACSTPTVVDQIITHPHTHGPVPRCSDVVMSYLIHKSTLFAPGTITLRQQTFPKIDVLGGKQGWLVIMDVTGRYQHTSVLETNRAAFLISHEEVVAVGWRRP